MPPRHTKGNVPMKASHALFLLLLASLAFAVAAPAQQPSASTRTWQQAERIDNNRVINETQFTLAGRFLDPPHGNVSAPPTLMLTCEPSDRKRNGEGKFISGQLTVGAPLKIVFVEPDEIHGTSYYPEVNITYRVDSEKPQDVQWPPRTDKTSISIDRQGARKILRGHAVVITVHEAFDSQVVMQFDFPESAEVLQTCGIREHK
jgi:hypothetical protein